MSRLFLIGFLLAGLPGCQKEEPKSAYLFTYFVGNGSGAEAIRYALSPDGFNYRALNNNEPVISSDSISSSGGVRDPYITRGHDNNYFYMVATDLYVPDMGWNNYALVMMKSKDLIHWKSTVINIPKRFEQFSNVNRVWAPQVIYDKKKNKYMVYFSMLSPGSYDKIYYTYANDSFTDLEQVPKQLFYNPTKKASIDADIVKDHGKYHLFFKTEGSDKGIAQAISDELTGDYNVQKGRVDQTDEQVEGSGTFKLIDTDKYILMYDMYTSGKYQFTESSDLKHFSVIDNVISMDFHPRHGAVMQITSSEAKRLAQKWVTPHTDLILRANSSRINQQKTVINPKNHTIHLSVKADTELKDFDPQFKILPGAAIKHRTPQNFTNGPVNYTVWVEGQKKRTYAVDVSVEEN